MSDLTFIELKKLERALGMEGGYVLNFSNRTFSEFFDIAFGINIYESKYNLSSGSKANLMREFWRQESNQLVGRVLDMLFQEWNEFKESSSPPIPPEECLDIVHRLLSISDEDDLRVPDKLVGENFKSLAKAVHDSIESGKPEIALDRLHTYCVKYLRLLCSKYNVDIKRDTPLHSIMGSYIKAIDKQSLIESEMTRRILKSSISIFDSYNFVRNERSLAHDNEVLRSDEAYLIFHNVVQCMRFIEKIENRTSRETVDSFNNIEGIQF